MKFRTTLPQIEYPFKISHNDPLVLLGSCFTEHITSKLESYKFKTISNPFGILYNPISICNGLNLILEQKQFTRDDLVFYNKKYLSYDFHGSYSSHEAQVALDNMNSSIQKVSNHLQNASVLFLSLGTAFAFKLKSQDRIVANCHKIPAQNFERELLTIDEIIVNLERLVNNLQISSPKIKLILTVSPVRHIRDGLIQNNLSKAILIQAGQHLCNKHSAVYYFPSYELLMDDLRDYRFFEKDLIHPNEMAVDYIWSYFNTAFFNAETQNLNKSIRKIKDSLNHKSFHPGSQETKKFLTKLKEQILQLNNDYESLDWVEEVQLLEQRIAEIL